MHSITHNKQLFSAWKETNINIDQYYKSLIELRRNVWPPPPAASSTTIQPNKSMKNNITYTHARTINN